MAAVPGAMAAIEACLAVVVPEDALERMENATGLREPQREITEGPGAVAAAAAS